MKITIKIILFTAASLLYNSCKQKTKTINDSPPQQEIILDVDTTIIEEDSVLTFPIYIYTFDTGIMHAMVQRNFDSLNAKFKNAGIQFEFVGFEHRQMPHLDLLTANNYQYYDDEMTDSLELDSIITLWLVDNEYPCNDVGCSITKGFSRVNGHNSSIVVGFYGWINSATVVHEFGHFFGLQHTDIDEIDDTPDDPGSHMEALVSWDDCQMYDRQGNKTPMVNNLMGYYSHCPNVSKVFTPMQLDVINGIAWNYKTKYAFRYGNSLIQ